MTTKIKAIGTQGPHTPLEVIDIERRELQPDDVRLQVLYCGICHSDLHQARNDFGISRYPMVPGHEIVGRVTGVGAAVKTFKEGDLAAVGCIVDSCGACSACQHDLEQFCHGEGGTVMSFNSPDNYLGGVTFGGFSQTYVCKESYTLRMPDSLDLAAAAPLLCAGITVYSPLRHWGAGAGKTVGVVGVGGLGHLAVRIASAMGAHVVVITTSESKIADARRLGAHDAILSTDPEQMARFTSKIDLVIDTVSAPHDIDSYLGLLAIDGSVVLVGLPPKPLQINAFSVISNRRSFSGSNIGGIAETQEMLDFCAKHGIVADVERIRPDEINMAFERLERNDVRYRFVIDISTLA
ncbi:MAG: zinc-binding dehydrogenase [Sphingomonas sp.]|nr:MAG: zinc-binding dehydrogenase [Sphingomonas sp.]